MKSKVFIKQKGDRYGRLFAKGEIIFFLGKIQILIFRRLRALRED